MKKFSFVLIFFASIFLTKTVFGLCKGNNYSINGDIRLRQVIFDNIIDLNDDTDDKYNFFRFKIRLYGDYCPTENLKFYAKITGEPRYYNDPDFDDNTKNEEFIIDNLYLQYKTGSDTIYTTTIGRQNIALGSKMFIFDGTPLDGSRTIYMDAIKEKIKYNDINFTIFASRVKRDDPFPKINDKDLILIEGDQYVYGLFVNGILSDSLKGEAYYYYHKIDDFDLKTNTIGSRIIKNFTNELKASLELALQFGDYGDQDVEDAYAAEITMTYSPKNILWKPELGISFTSYSGDDPNSSDYEGLDLIYGRWPRLSELYIYTYIKEKRISLMENLQKYTMSLKIKPRKNITFFTSASYLKAKTLFNITKNLSGHIWYEYLSPKNYYAENNRDNAYFFRYELMYKF